MIDIVNRLGLDATRCELQFSKGVAGNIEEAIGEIKRLREVLMSAQRIIERDFPSGQLVIDIRAALPPIAGANDHQ
jgi:hypothetical protein